MSVRTLAELQAICFTWYPISPFRHPPEEIMSLEQQVNFDIAYRYQDYRRLTSGCWPETVNRGSSIWCA
jgi:hypothetical protein